MTERGGVYKMGNKFYDSWQKFLSEGDGWVDPFAGNPDAQKRYYLQLGAGMQTRFKEEYPDYPYDEWDAESTDDDELDYDPDDAPAGVLGKEYRDSIARFRVKQHKEDPTLRARIWEEEND